jgi:hypothetical protein
MPKLLASVKIVSLTLVCGALCLCFACDGDQQKADRQMQEDLQKADAQHAAAADMDALDAVQSKYDALVNTPNISNQMKVVVRGKEAEVRLERSMKMAADLRSRELAITRAISDLERLGLQVAGLQSGIAALQKYDSAQAIASLTDKEDQIKGNTANSDNGPTLKDLGTQIDTLTAQITKGKADTEAAKQASSKDRDQAETLSPQAEGETGEAPVQDNIKAANLRKDAAISDGQIDVLTSQIADLQSALDGAQSQKSARDEEVATMDGLIAAQQSSWGDVQKQIDAQRKQETGIIGTDDSSAAAPVAAPASADQSGATADQSQAAPAPTQAQMPPDALTIASRAAQLRDDLRDAATLRQTVNDELDKAIDEYDSTFNAAQSLVRDLRQQIGQKTNDPDAPIWQQTMDALHPGDYALQKASAMETKAAVGASEAEINVMLGQLMNGYQVSGKTGNQQIPGLTALLSRDKTGIDPPKSLGDLTPPDDSKISDMEKNVDTLFQGALDGYAAPGTGGIDVGPSAKARANDAIRGQSTTNRQWARYAMLIGDAKAGASHLKDADSDDQQLISGISPSADSQTPDQSTSTDTNAATPNADTSGNANTDSTAATAPSTGDNTVSAPATGDNSTPSPATGDNSTAPPDRSR